MLKENKTRIGHDFGCTVKHMHTNVPKHSSKNFIPNEAINILAITIYYCKNITNSI